MDERKKFVNAAASWIGVTEKDSRFSEIISTYNTLSPLPRNHKAVKSDPWCAIFVTASGIRAGLGDIILPECSCSEMIKLYKDSGSWIENDSYVPLIGDIVMYDWQDGKNYETTDNTGAPDHVGIVYSIVGNTMTIIEGNRGERVDYRTLDVNGRYIRGYCLPKFDSEKDKNYMIASALDSIISALEELRSVFGKA